MLLETSVGTTIWISATLSADPELLHIPYPQWEAYYYPENHDKWKYEYNTVLILTALSLVYLYTVTFLINMMNLFVCMITVIIIFLHKGGWMSLICSHSSNSKWLPLYFQRISFFFPLSCFQMVSWFLPELVSLMKHFSPGDSAPVSCYS